jgi:heme O synthase-like polyprenyltransferase
MKKKIWEDFTELLKIEVTIISMTYVVFGFVLTAISAQNQLLFNLAQGSQPDSFIPYSPIYNSIVIFTILNLIWIAIAFIGAFIDEAKTQVQKPLAALNMFFFICSLGYFAKVSSDLAVVFYF